MNSCHRCLRGYGNMPYHPLLDWRLALDMARLALDSKSKIDMTQSYWRSLIVQMIVQMIVQIVPAYLRGLNYTQTTIGSLPAGLDVATEEIIIITHPLWDHDQSNFRPEIANAVADAEAHGWKWKLCSLFRAVRFLYE